MLKITESLDFIESNLEFTDRVTIGEIALATSLSWLEFRELTTITDAHPKLSHWYSAFSNRSSMMCTTLQGDTQD